MNALSQFIPRNSQEITAEWIAFVLRQEEEFSNASTVSYQIVSGAEPGCNYATAVYGIQVYSGIGASCDESETSNGRSAHQNGHRKDLIVKLPHHDIFGRLFCRLSRCYERELYVYQNIFPLLESALSKKNGAKNKSHIPKSGLNHEKLSVPVLHHGVTDGEARLAMVMDDLRAAGYLMPSQSEMLTSGQIQSALKALAQISAAFLAIIHGDQAANSAESFVNNELLDIRRLWISEIVDVDLIRLGLQGYINFLGNYTGKEALVASLEALLPCARSIMTEGMHGAGFTKLRSLCHGDLWKLNMMFRGMPDAPNKVMLIDWQHCHFGNPLVDIFSLLSNNTSLTFRQKHTKEMVLFFRNQLCSHLDELGVEPAKWIPTESQIMKDYRLSMKAAMIRVIFDIVLPLASEDTLEGIESGTSDGKIVQLIADAMKKKTTDKNLEKHLLDFADEMHEYG